MPGTKYWIAAVLGVVLAGLGQAQEIRFQGTQPDPHVIFVSLEDNPFLPAPNLGAPVASSPSAPASGYVMAADIPASQAMVPAPAEPCTACQKSCGHAGNRPLHRLWLWLTYKPLPVPNYCKGHTCCGNCVPPLYEYIRYRYPDGVHCEPRPAPIPHQACGGCGTCTGCRR